MSEATHDDLKRRLAEAEDELARRVGVEHALRKSEDNLRVVLNGIGDAFYVLDPQSRFEFASRTALDLWGLPASEVIGRRIQDVFPAVSGSESWAAHERVLATGQAARLETVSPVLQRWIEVEITPTPVGGISVAFRDIEARKRAEIALRDSEERYRSLFETMGQGYCHLQLVRDDAGRAVDQLYFEFNPALERLFGVDAASARGRTANEVFGDRVLPWTQTFDRVWESGRPARIEQELGERWFEVHVYPRHSDRMVLLFEEITERKRTEAALRESEERQAFLLKLSDVLRPLADTADIMGAASELLGNYLGVDRVGYGEVDATGASLRVQRDWSNGVMSSAGGLHSLSEFVPGREAAFLRGEVFVEADATQTQDGSPTVRQNSQDIGATRASIAVPLVKAGEVVAGLYVQQSTARTWSEAEKWLVSDVAERTWAAVERARVENALRESQERLTLAAEVGQLASWDWDLASGQVSWNERHFRMQGYAPGEVTPSFEAWLARVHPQDRVRAIEKIEQARDARTTYVHQFRSLHPDGTVRWCSARGRFFYLANGKPYRMVGVTEDITERRQAENALRDSEERFQQFARASSAGIWIRDAETLVMEFVSPAIGQIYGVPAESMLGGIEKWASMIVPEDRDLALRHIERARQGESVTHEFRIQRPSDREFRWIRNTDFPLGGNGHAQRVGGIAEDVTDVKLGAEHQAVLLSELQHRVRNIMAVIRSIAGRTAENAGSVAEYAELLTGRLHTLSRVQALLTRAPNAKVNLAAIVQEELAALTADASQFDVSGPDVMLPAKAAETMTLAIHELSTNALKYGALATPAGRVAVRWDVVDRRGTPWLIFDWRESGAPLGAQPSALRRTGFGSELIEGRIPYELRGSGKVTIESAGAQCHLEFPLGDGASVLETDAPKRAKVFGGVIDMTGQANLTGQRVLVVEDDYYLASDTARALRGAGAEVMGPCAKEEDARSEMLRARPTCAVLDVNLGSGPTFELARQLKESGVPFLFLTGYDPGVMDADLAGTRRLQKPVSFKDVVSALADMMAPREG